MTTYATLNDLHSDRQTDADRADVRAVQVVGWQECHHVNLTTALGATHGVHQVRELANPGKAGVAVTWRKDAATLIAKGLALGHMAVEGMMGRFLAWVVLEIDGRKHLVISGHRPPLRLKALWPAFDANVDALIDRLRAEHKPDVVVVLLDSNQDPPTPLITRTGLAWHGVGIDGALVSGAAVTNVHPLPLGDSDHRPVVMTVTPKEKPMDVIRVGTDSSGRPIKMTRYMAAWWEQVKAALPFTPVIVQGAWMAGDGAAASAGYHDGGGCLDIRTRDKTTAQIDLMIRVLRLHGAGAWRRDAAHGGMDPHIHLVLGSDFGLAPGARAQWVEYLNGGDGLTGTRRDYEWRPSPLVTTPPPRIQPQPEEDEVSAQEVWNHPVPFTGDPDKVGDKRPVFISVVETHNAVEQIKEDIVALNKKLDAILAAVKEA